MLLLWLLFPSIVSYYDSLFLSLLHSQIPMWSNYISWSLSRRNTVGPAFLFQDSLRMIVFARMQIPSTICYIIVALSGHKKTCQCLGRTLFLVTFFWRRIECASNVVIPRKGEQIVSLPLNFPQKVNMVPGMG